MNKRKEITEIVDNYFISEQSVKDLIDDLCDVIEEEPLTDQLKAVQQEMDDFQEMSDRSYQNLIDKKAIILAKLHKEFRNEKNN